MVIHRLVLVLLLLAITSSCGEKLPLPVDVDDDDGGRLTDTTYIPVLPHWTSANGIDFNYPFGVSLGYDQTIYICDTRNDRIVRLTKNGEFIESFSLPHPYGVAQDRALTLAAVNGGNKIYLRRNPEGGDFSEYLELDSVYRCEQQPNGPEVCWWDVPRFEVIAATRETKSVFYTEAFGRVRFFFGDRYQPNPRVFPVVDSGAGVGKVYNPSGVAVGVVDGKSRLIVVQYPGVYGAQYLSTRSYTSLLNDPNSDVFRRLLDDTKYVAADDQGNVFVLHRARGIVMMFDKNGKYVLSFGRDGTDPLSLQDPTGIAVVGDMVLIADAKNNRISRYQFTATPQN